MKDLLKDLKTNEFKQIYLLHGEERYLVRQFKDRLKKALVPTGDTMNLSVFEGKACEEKAIIDLAETMPFFAERRAIFLEDSGLVKKGGDTLAEYLPDMPETTFLVLTEQEVDKRNKLYKQIQKNGRVVEFKRQKEDDIVKWIVGKLNRENKKITRAVMQQFLEKTGDDMERISMELDKLLSYTLEKDIITSEDVETICCQQLDVQIYELINEIGNRHTKAALDRYYDLLEEKEPPMRILYSLNRQFKILMDLRELMDKGYDYKYMSEKLGIHEYRVRKTMAQVRSFSQEQLELLLRSGVRTEEQVKTGAMGEQIAVELFLIEALNQ